MIPKIKSVNNLGFGIRYELQQLKSAGKLTETQIHQIETEALQFFVRMCSHMIEKGPLNSSFARCLQSLSSGYMVECSGCELLCEKLLKLVGYNGVTPSVPDKAKLEYSLFIYYCEGK